MVVVTYKLTLQHNSPFAVGDVVKLASTGSLWKIIRKDSDTVYIVEAVFVYRADDKVLEAFAD